jgi:hypothetical protein
MLAPVRRFLPKSPIFALALGFTALRAGDASAHVKWFCAFDVAGQPRGLENVLCPDFEYLTGLAALALVAGCVVETTSVGASLQRALNRVTAPLASQHELLFRAICGFFFVSVWAMGGVLLTPELKTNSNAAGCLQLAIAAAMLSRRTLPLGGLGIVLLFVSALWSYGLFHLMDYPIFLGIAAYLALTGLGRNLFGMRPLDVVRWATAITLMWASIEKWAYPEWSFPLFAIHPSLTMGYDDEFFMRAAGVIEFTLAFGLLWTPLVRRASAIVLTAMFASAIVEFGKLDAIGHAPILAVLLAIIGDPANVAEWAQRRWRGTALAPVGLAAALVLFLGLYYAMHTLLFGAAVA